MSALGLVNVVQNLSNQNLTQNTTAEAPPQSNAGQPNLQVSAVPDDQYTPSAQNGQAEASAQAAGLFSVPQTLTFTAAAALVLGQNAASQVGAAAAASPATSVNAPTQQSTTNILAQQIATPTTTATSTAATEVQAAPAASAAASTAAAVNTQPAATTPAAQAAAPAPTVPASASAAAPGASATATTTLLESQEQLQALNLALAALGLSTQDIDQLDRIASTNNDYNPSAYTAQAYQLEALAQQPSPQAAATTVATTQPAPSNAITAANPTALGSGTVASD